ncbi:MAG: tetratricopeptide repeat protein [Calditrichota bacterium]
MLKTLVILACGAFLLSACGGSPQATKGKAFLLYEQGKYEESLPLLEKSFAGGLDDPELVVRLAYCRSEVKGDVTAAIEILRDSALRYPDYARTYYQLGFIAYNHGPDESQQNIKQAIGFTRRAADLAPQDFKIIDNLGMFYLLTDQFDSALARFDQALKINPEDAELKTRIAQAKDFKQRLAEVDSLAAKDTLRLK